MELHRSVIGELLSFYDGGDYRQRQAVMASLKYGGNGAGVCIPYALQGDGFFAALSEHIEALFADNFIMLGYTWPEHIQRYSQACGPRIRVDELWRAHPYGDDGPEMAFIAVRRTGPDSRPVGPPVIWDD